MTLRGMATVSYYAADWNAARDWYTRLTGIEPYFLRDGYAEWRLGDRQAELGLIDARYRAPGTPSGPVGAVLYWHVDDVEATMARLLELGATVHEAPLDRGEGFVTATVIDPFGNLLGVMYNPHYLEMLGAS
ncbi:VOC family protein [Actinoplanes hulinensis]|uniref:VOC family protein n=1 Tax=Actinoplanes hulinensis TaxID=1144547 RepID=A0ABS7B201_9ACTN|nr:VOC family protein [Actinoplanes hulinensis]MBW6435043.1 VOC family protein [Actinoplanes hulinensis]